MPGKIYLSTRLKLGGVLKPQLPNTDESEPEPFNPPQARRGVETQQYPSSTVSK